MYRFVIRGTVQGVGFRPFIYREATRQGVVGYVRNFGEGVEVVVDSPEFVDNIQRWPPLASIDAVEQEEVHEGPYETFSIHTSKKSDGETQLPPDIFTCEDCLRELRDPDDRRYGYFFITCTNCGPRFSMIEDYPYDRPTTSMSDFPMCEKCEAEYTEVTDRRYHAQTVACHHCGPRLLLQYNHMTIGTGNDDETVRKSCELLKEGKILSIKGVGGFHIASLARDDVVLRVRQMLNRPEKPFALMVRDMEMARTIADIGEVEEAHLLSPQRPIVVVRKKGKGGLKQVSELDSVGIMLPYTALHYLLFDHLDEALVMTSANMPGEPVAIEEELGDYFLTHTRRIVNRCDDSVMKVIDGSTQFLRRSRGYAPRPVKLPFSCEDTLAVGAEMNNVIAITRGTNAYLSQYIGSTDKYATFEFFKEAVDKMLALTRAKPVRIVADLHPDFNTTRYAKKLAERMGCEFMQVQHHKAHVASVAGEHGLNEYVGIACDGVGYGEDGTIWGGEVFRVQDGSFTRIGRLEQVPMLGGDSATRYPKKMLFGILSQAIGSERLLALDIFPREEAKLYLRQIEQGFNLPFTSSTGRVLDAVAALLGLCDYASYEGRAAMLLESVAKDPLDMEPMINAGDVDVLMTSPLFKELLSRKGKGAGILAATAQAYIARGLLTIAKKPGLPIVFSGGVAYNRMITSILQAEGVYFHRSIPAGDGCISYGQAIIANL